MINGIEEEYSDLGKSLKESSKNIAVYETYDQDLIENSLKKSYIFQMSGSDKKPIFEKKETHANSMQQSLLRSQARIKTMITEAIQEKQEQEEEQNEENFFNISNLGSNEQSFDCCSVPQDNFPATLILTPSKELLFYHYGTNNLIYSLNFNTIWAQLSSRIEIQSCFIINVCPEFIIKVENCYSKNKLKKLYNNICQIIRKSWGKQYKMMSLSKVPNFYENKYKPAMEFFENAETGDLLLFKGSHFFAEVQRFFTNSEYDHVGMVIRDQVYGLLIFESNSASGVCLTPWQFVLKYKWYQSIPRIVWRQLKGVKRQNSFNDLIHQFVLANIGKQYYISINKLITTKSYIPESKEEVGFFCSELVAAIYKDLGLLTRDTESPYFKPGSNFIPYHFTQKHDLHLQEGSLSDEYILHFHDELIEKQHQL